MSDMFDNPLVRDIKKMLNEQIETSFVLNVGGKVARTLDFSDNIDDPAVNLYGYGTMRVSFVKKDIKRDLIKLADMVGNRDAKDLLVYLSDFDGKKSSGMYFAWRMYALMEIEEFMKRPEIKRKITLMRKKKQGI